MTWLDLRCCAWTWHKSLCQMPQPKQAPLGILKCKGGSWLGERVGLSAILARAACFWACARHFLSLCQKESFKPPRRQHVRAATCNSPSPASGYCQSPNPFWYGGSRKNGVQLAFRSHQLAFKPEHKSSARFTLHKMSMSMATELEMEMEMAMELELGLACEDSTVSTGALLCCCCGVY